jgi:hypothetical protein
MNGMGSLRLALPVMLSVSIAFAIASKPSAMEGTVKKVDRTARTIVVKTADGAEHTLHFTTRTAVHGSKEVAKGAEEGFHGVKEGSEVVVHYTTRGAEDTAREIDNIGKDGLKAAEGTVSHIDRGAKTVVVKSADGTEETYHLADRAAKDSGKDVVEGSQKSAKVTVYYTEEAGRKVVHFFKTTI